MKAHENPFRAERIEQIPFRFGERSIDQLVDQLKDQAFCGAIVGPQGSGKTTLLELLCNHLKEKGNPTKLLSFEHAGYSEIHGLFSEIHRLPAGTTLFVDGADAVSPVRRWMLKTICRIKRFGLVITSHKAGIVPTLVENQTSIKLLQSLISELIPASQSEQIPTGELFHRHDWNIRHCFRELYDQFSFL